MRRKLFFHMGGSLLLVVLLVGLVPAQAQDNGPLDVERLSVIATYEHDMMAGPGRSGAGPGPTCPRLATCSLI